MAKLQAQHMAKLETHYGHPAFATLLKDSVISWATASTFVFSTGRTWPRQTEFAQIEKARAQTVEIERGTPPLLFTLSQACHAILTEHIYIRLNPNQ